MASTSLLTMIAAQPSIEALQSLLESQRNDDRLRANLLECFDGVFEYEDATQWTTAVHICEALAIVGWGRRERVDAISRFNGDCWESYFINARGEKRFREARWSRRKAGWGLWNPAYHASPDFPTRPPVSWEQHAGTKFPLVDCPSLTSQRNYRKQLPIIMGLIGGDNATSRCVAELKRELADQLTDSMDPVAYGEALESFYFTLHCPYSDTTFEPRLKVGAYRAKSKSFSCDLFFSNNFVKCDRKAQKAYFQENLVLAIAALESKLRKKEVDYDIARFRADVLSACDSWMRTMSMK